MDSILHLTNIVEAYDHPGRYLEDELIYLDVLLEFEIERIRAKQQLVTEPPGPYRGMYFSENEARLLLNDEFLYVQLDSDQRLLLEQLRQRIHARIERSEQEGIVLPIHHLRNVLKLTDVEILALIVAVAPHMDRKYLKLYGYVQDDMTCQYVTIDLLLHLCCVNEEERAYLVETILNSQSNLSSFFHFKLHTTPMSEATILTEPLYLKTRIVHFLLGVDWTYSGGLASIERYTDSEGSLPPLWIQSSIQKSIIRYMNDLSTKDTTCCLIAIQGESGSGKTLQARYVCQDLKRTYLQWGVTYASEELEIFQQEVEDFLLEAKLLNAVPGFDQLHHLLNETSDSNKVDRRFDWLMKRLARWQDFVFLLSDKPITPPAVTSQMRWVDITIPLPDMEQSALLWKRFTSPWYSIPDDEVNMLAGKFRFTPGLISATIESAKQLDDWMRMDKPDGEQQRPSAARLLHQSAYRIIDTGLKHKAVKIEPAFDWDDLILPQETIELLRQACHRLKDRHLVMHRWGFDRKLPYGRGVSMMFTGPPGTGKTMSAQVMAKELEAELYRIDLSRIVSKYIGETEKNLSEIFEYAKRSGAILFFDEADALFGKRTEVKDSHDKFANMETSYLLQKMEEYDGITILATNFSQNMDEAFTRRIQFIVKYPFPNASEREQLWRSSLPTQLPTESIDFAFLAKTFELSGGPIKNIVLTAVYLAAHERTVLTMRHMIKAAIQEYKKMGKLLLKDHLGPYADLWKG